MNPIISIIHVAVPVPLYKFFDYLPPINTNSEIKNLEPGTRVRVPFGKREVVGIVITVDQVLQAGNHALKPVLEILEDTPVFSPLLLKLARWAAEYYHHPLGEVLTCMLPVLLRRNKPGKYKKINQALPDFIQEQQEHVLNIHQEQAVNTITQTLGSFQVFLLDGVTGSGKTEVYLQIIKTVLRTGQQALVLVPEISLTPQTIARFAQRFNVPIAVLHSGLSDGERLNAWRMAKEGIASIIIGTRSAVFTPLAKAGIIIIDEEHDLSFKQQEGFRYCARDLALVRARLEKIPVVLGSATPSLESFYNARQKRYQALYLPARVNTAALPQFSLIDLRNQKLENGLSAQLLNSIRRHVENNGQILLFLNRRGFAPLLICHACGWIAHCTRCDAKLIYHQQPVSLLCHHCAATQAVNTQCPTCHSQNLFPLGLGTQRLEQTLAKHFPTQGIVRIDRDSTRRKGTLQNILDTIHSGENKILVGTQMIAKGHHFPEVTLVAILDADSGLFSADFRAGERTAQLLLQVAGRAGRADRLGEVIIQTHNPNHPLLAHLLQHDYSGFADTALRERQAANLPPYVYLALIRSEAITQHLPLNFLKQIRHLAEKLCLPEIKIAGPIPALMERRAGRYRAQLLIQTTHRSALHKLINYLITKIPDLPTSRCIRWSLDIDPREMI